MVRLPGAVVSGDWLAAHLSPVQAPGQHGDSVAAPQDEVRVVDVRWYLDGRSGHDAYLSGHIPGAVWLDMDTDLSDPPSPAAGRHPLPAPERFAAALARTGIAVGTPVVAYDDAGGSIAARLWWLLHVLREPVAVLDGGIAGWPGELETAVPKPRPVHRPVRPWPAHRFLTADQVTAGSSAVLDARTFERYLHGGPIDPRPGHIPGARSLPWHGNLDAQGRFLSSAKLRERYRDVAARPVVAYCGSGVTACHALLALHLAGHEDNALYPGSWSQWGADASRPAET